MKNPILSVVVPVYNEEAGLGAAVYSWFSGGDGRLEGARRGMKNGTPLAM